jgi:hypothetical protein
MATFLLNDAALWVSKLPETAFNTGYTLTAEFEKVRSNQPVTLLPNYDFTTDAGKPGNGHEFATQRCLTFTQPPAIAIQDEVNNEMLGRLLLRSLGGTVTPLLVSGTAYKHTAPMLPVASGRQLPSSTVITQLGAADFRLDGMVVERFKISQTRADAPQVECDLVGSGKFITPNGVASLSTTPSVISCLDGNFTILQWTDAGGARDFTAGEGFRNFSVEIVNNHKLNDRLAGDPTNTLTYETVTVNPAYQRRLIRGSRVVNASITIPLNSTKVEWEKYTIGQQLTDVIFKPRGPIISGAVRASIAYFIPKAKIASMTTGEDDGDATVTITLDAMYDSTSLGAVTGEVVNTTTTNFK